MTYSSANSQSCFTPSGWYAVCLTILKQTFRESSQITPPSWEKENMYSDFVEQLAFCPHFQGFFLFLILSKRLCLSLTRNCVLCTTFSSDIPILLDQWEIIPLLMIPQRLIGFHFEPFISKSCMIDLSDYSIKFIFLCSAWRETHKGIKN